MNTYDIRYKAMLEFIRQAISYKAINAFQASEILSSIFPGPLEMFMNDILDIDTKKDNLIKD